MRKIIITLAAIAAAFSTFSCNKETATPDSNPAIGERTVVIASTEAGTAKTTLSGNDTDGYDVFWSEGDQIKIIGQDGFDKYYTLVEGAGTTRGVFSGDPIPEGEYRAFYSVTGTQLPDTQEFQAGKIANSPMCADIKVESGKENETSFWNLCGLLRITIKCSTGKKVSSIVVSSDQHMAGLITIYADKTVSVSDSSWPIPSSKSVTLDCGEQGVALSANGTDFYIALPANEYSGVTMVINYTDGTSDTKSLKSTKTLSVSRAKITPVTFNMIPEGALAGIFTVSAEGKKVLFSKGNLKYDVQKAEWGFYDKQTHHHSSSSASSSEISHFTWGYGEWSTDPYTTSYEGGTFKDWGTAIDDKGTWRTLSVNEWKYLVDHNTYRFIDLEDGYSGCIIAPDEFLTDYSFNKDKTDYSMKELAKAEAAGFIFLAHDGVREGNKMGVHTGGYYWTSSDFGKGYTISYYMYLSGNYPLQSGNGEPRSRGMSVRLVTDVK